jgi:hypothetical protein
MHYPLGPILKKAYHYRKIFKNKNTYHFLVFLYEIKQDDDT